MESTDMADRRVTLASVNSSNIGIDFLSLLIGNLHTPILERFDNTINYRLDQ